MSNNNNVNNDYVTLKECVELEDLKALDRERNKGHNKTGKGQELPGFDKGYVLDEAEDFSELYSKNMASITVNNNAECTVNNTVNSALNNPVGYPVNSAVNSTVNNALNTVNSPVNNSVNSPVNSTVDTLDNTGIGYGVTSIKPRKRGLDATMKKCAELLVMKDVNGMSNDEIAAAIGIDRSTLYRWKQRPDFNNYLNQLADEFQRSFLADAFVELRKIMYSGKTHEKLKALELILKNQGRLKDVNEVKATVEQDIDVTAILNNLGV